MDTDRTDHLPHSVSIPMGPADLGRKNGGERSSGSHMGKISGHYLSSASPYEGIEEGQSGPTKSPKRLFSWGGTR